MTINHKLLAFWSKRSFHLVFVVLILMIDAKTRSFGQFFDLADSINAQRYINFSPPCHIW